MEYKKKDLLELEELIEVFKDYLKNVLDYNEEDATLVAKDLENPYMTPYIYQEYEDKIVNIDGIEYEVINCFSDLGLCRNYHITQIQPFKFDMLIDTTNIEDGLVSEYVEANKLYYLK